MGMVGSGRDLPVRPYVPPTAFLAAGVCASALLMLEAGWRLHDCGDVVSWPGALALSSMSVLAFTLARRLRGSGSLRLHRSPDCDVRHGCLDRLRRRNRLAVEMAGGESRGPCAAAPPPSCSFVATLLPASGVSHRPLSWSTSIWGSALGRFAS